MDRGGGKWAGERGMVVGGVDRRGGKWTGEGCEGRIGSCK